ncbi:hypothetical protein C8Q76DRAFT_760068 [Earliella scabrosa]|nr:hypothetical protein C8Q76DRAFT_760068 [Earliella scabrosa]
MHDMDRVRTGKLSTGPAISARARSPRNQVTVPSADEDARIAQSRTHDGATFTRTSCALETTFLNGVLRKTPSNVFKCRCTVELRFPDCLQKEGSERRAIIKPPAASAWRATCLSRSSRSQRTGAPMRPIQILPGGPWMDVDSVPPQVEARTDVICPVFEFILVAEPPHRIGAGPRVRVGERRTDIVANEPRTKTDALDVGWRLIAICVRTRGRSIEQPSPSASGGGGWADARPGNRGRGPAQGRRTRRLGAGATGFERRRWRTMAVCSRHGELRKPRRACRLRCRRTAVATPRHSTMTAA